MEEEIVKNGPSLGNLCSLFHLKVINIMCSLANNPDIIVIDPDITAISLGLKAHNHLIILVAEESGMALAYCCS